MKQHDRDTLRRTFSENLRILASRSDSVARLCRELGVNRTQFNRYLAAEAHPRPEILHKICQHFEIDARILLQPLSELSQGQEQRPANALDPAHFLNRMVEFDHALVPDGYYRMLRPPAVRPKFALSTLLVLKRLPNGMKQVQAALPRYYFEMVGQALPWRSRRLHAFALRNTEGFSIIFDSPPPGRLSQFSYFSAGYFTAPSTFFGFSAFSQNASELQAQIVPVILRYVGPRLKDGLEIRRNQKDVPFNELNEGELDYFRNWNPLGPIDRLKL